jgi:glycosyltransferase involved in cell wall biosynthesis
MRVLHFKTTMRLEDGGVVKAVLDLVQMRAHTHEVGLATLAAGGTPESWRDGSATNIRIHELPGAPGPAQTLTSKQLKALGALIREYDVVHLHSMWPPANPQIAKLCVELGKPYILSVHGMLDDWCMSQRRGKKMLYMRTWGRNLLRDAHTVHCTAQAELEQASVWFDAEKGVSVPLPFDLSEYEELPAEELAYASFEGLSRKHPKVLFLSRIHYKKGVDRLIKASALLVQRDVRHQLVIAGTGDEEYVQEMKSLAKAQGVEGHTYFLGFASGEPKVALFRACDLFALPTSQENFGFVFFEALAAGTPVLTTKGTDTWPEIEQSGGGVIADNTPEAFAQHLEGLLGDVDQLKSMGAAGREWVQREMAIDQIIEAYNAMYQRCEGSMAGGA